MNSIDDSELHKLVEKVVNQVMGNSSPGPSSKPVPPVAVPSGEAQKPPAVADPAPKGSNKIVAIGSDHGGFDLKDNLKTYLAELGYEVKDVGAYNKSAVDYPDFAHEVARQVSHGKAWRGIMIDGAGIGSCIVANKVPGIRAGMAYDYSSAVNSREHNDTNVLTLGAGLIGIALARQIVKVWLSTDFGGGRHQPRIDKITAVEKQYTKL